MKESKKKAPLICLKETECVRRERLQRLMGCGGVEDAEDEASER